MKKNKGLKILIGCASVLFLTVSVFLIKVNIDMMRTEENVEESSVEKGDIASSENDMNMTTQELFQPLDNTMHDEEGDMPPNSKKYTTERENYDWYNQDDEQTDIDIFDFPKEASEQEDSILAEKTDENDESQNESHPSEKTNSEKNNEEVIDLPIVQFD